MNVLVTGGAGFIGANLIRRLLTGGHEVRVLDDLSTGTLSNLEGLPVTLVVGSVCDREVVDQTVEGVDAVVHLAARGSVQRSIDDPISTNDVNSTGTLNVLQAARSFDAHVVFASSSSVYGANREVPRREGMWARPLSPYGASKLAAESYSLAYREVFGLDVLVLRFFNVYGPLQRHDHEYAAVIPRFIWRAMNGQEMIVEGDGDQTRDFTHVGSVVDVIEESLRMRLTWPSPVNLAFGDRITINGLAREIEQAVGHVVPRVHSPARRGDVRDSQNDPALLRELFPGLEPIGIREGIASVVAWMNGERPTAQREPDVTGET